MSRIDEVSDELRKLIGFDFVIVKSTVYKHDMATIKKIKSELVKYRQALEEITQYTSSDAESADAMREIAEEAIG